MCRSVHLKPLKVISTFMHFLASILLFCISYCHQSFLFTICFSFLSFFPSVFALSGFLVVANCSPQCQNGGMCLRPQLCVCKPGSKGNACEQQTVPTHPFPLPGSGPTNGHGTGSSNGHTYGHNGVPHRPIPQQAAPSGYAPLSSNTMAQMKLSVKPALQHVRPHYVQQQ